MVQIVSDEKNRNQVKPQKNAGKPQNSTIGYSINVRTRGANMQYKGHGMRGGRFGGNKPPENIT